MTERNLTYQQKLTNQVATERVKGGLYRKTNKTIKEITEEFMRIKNESGFYEGVRAKKLKPANNKLIDKEETPNKNAISVRQLIYKK